jgi:hypothetical protein
MLRKVFHQLLLGFVAIQEKFLSGSKGQAAHIAVRHTRCLPNKSDNLQVPLCHSVIVADRQNCLVLTFCALSETTVVAIRQCTEIFSGRLSSADFARLNIEMVLPARRGAAI